MMKEEEEEGRGEEEVMMVVDMRRTLSWHGLSEVESIHKVQNPRNGSIPRSKIVHALISQMFVKFHTCLFCALCRCVAY